MNVCLQKVVITDITGTFHHLSFKTLKGLAFKSEGDCIIWLPFSENKDTCCYRQFQLRLELLQICIMVNTHTLLCKRTIGQF